MSYVLTPVEIQQFWHDGFIRIPHFFHRIDIANITKQYYDIFLPQLQIHGILPSQTMVTRPTWPELQNAIICLKKNYSSTYKNCCDEVHRIINLQNLSLDTRLINIITQLGISRPTLHQSPILSTTIKFMDTTDNLANNYQLWKTWRSSINSVGAFVYLSPAISEHNTYLAIKPASHTGGIRSQMDIATIHNEAFDNQVAQTHHNMQYGSDLILFSPLTLSRLPNDDMVSVMWGYSDLDDPFYKQYEYRPPIYSPVANAMIEFLAQYDAVKSHQKK